KPDKATRDYVQTLVAVAGGPRVALEPILTMPGPEFIVLRNRIITCIDNHKLGQEICAPGSLAPLVPKEGRGAMAQVREIRDLACQEEGQQRAEEFLLDDVPTDIVDQGDGKFTVRATYPDDVHIPGAVFVEPQPVPSDPDSSSSPSPSVSPSPSPSV